MGSVKGVALRIACAPGLEHLGGGCPRSMVDGETEAEEWLGGVATLDGRDVQLPERVKDYLMAGFKKDVWTMDDVLEEDVRLEGPALASLGQRLGGSSACVGQRRRLEGYPESRRQVV